MKERRSEITRETKETKIALTLNLDGVGAANISTGIGFLDHLLTTLTLHARIDLDLRCEGDLHTDDHHTAEDCAIALGSAINKALGDRKGIRRFGCAYAPLDEALARVVLDLSGRPSADVCLSLKREKIGDLSVENIPHFLRSMAGAALMTLHADTLKGENDHHKAEAAFKALALALREALLRTGEETAPSAKGTLV